MDPKITALEKKIDELEHELALKEQDLLRFKTELVKANQALEKLIQQISQELRVTGLIQKALVPTEYPNISGIEFSTKFIPGFKRGGDYFDIFEHEDKLRFGILISSASGYSMSALLLSVLLKMTGQMEARKGAEPHKIIELIAKEVCPNIQKSDSASVFYGVIDRRTFEMQYSYAGNISTLALSFGNGKVQSVAPATPPLTADYQGKPQTQSVGLNARDRLVFCTDGAIRVANADGEQFGRERLTQAVLRAPKSGVHELRNEIIFRLEQHAGAGEFPEDITVIVTEVKDRVIKLAKA